MRWGEEIWAAVPGFARHEVSSEGRVRVRTGSHVLRAGAVLAQKIERNGYARVTLCHAGLRSQHHVARLVLLAFVGPPPSDAHHAAHGNGDKLNNRVENLRWALPAENEADKVEHGTMPFGRRHPNAKLNDEVVLRLRMRSANGESFGSIARSTGVPMSTVQKVCHRQTWRHLP